MVGTGLHICVVVVLALPVGAATFSNVSRAAQQQAYPRLLLWPSSSSCLQVWLTYTAGTGFIIFLSTGQTRMARSTPRRAYMWFLGLHQACVVGGLMGYVTMIFSLMALPPAISEWVGPFGLMMTWYGLYFGILNRDCAEVAATRMVCLHTSSTG